MPSPEAFDEHGRPRTISTPQGEMTKKVRQLGKNRTGTPSIDIRCKQCGKQFDTYSQRRRTKCCE